MIETLLSGVNQGLIWALLALGFFIAFRLLDFADMTCEGSITLGASITALCIWNGLNPFLAMIISFLTGCVAGMITGLLHTKLKIPPILSGIITMSALYSINIHIMSLATGTDGTANLSLLNFRDGLVYSVLKSVIPLNTKYVSLIFGVVVVLAITGVLYWFFGTELGCAIRATGNNEKMCRAQGINTDTTKIVGLALANGLIALSGSLLGQYQSYSDVKLGVGSIVIGLASIIIGEAIFAKCKSFFVKLLGIVIGSIIYRVIITLIIYLGMPSNDLKLVTAIVVVVALSITTFKADIQRGLKWIGSKFKKNGGAQQ